MKKALSFLMILVTCLGIFAGCGTNYELPANTYDVTHGAITLSIEESYQLNAENSANIAGFDTEGEDWPSCVYSNDVAMITITRTQDSKQSGFSKKGYADYLLKNLRMNYSSNEKNFITMKKYNGVHCVEDAKRGKIYASYVEAGYCWEIIVQQNMFQPDPAEKRDAWLEYFEQNKGDLIAMITSAKFS